MQKIHENITEKTPQFCAGIADIFMILPVYFHETHKAFPACRKTSAVPAESYTVLTESSAVLTESSAVLTESFTVFTECSTVFTERSTVLTECSAVLTERSTVLTEIISEYPCQNTFIQYNYSMSNKFKKN
ncbi:MAG: hypothetical protein LBJ17_04155 [Dysgonamonadaceae bacterium]|nr:hypothetical protein [Dysgonamonadaceae bacterium]